MRKVMFLMVITLSISLPIFLSCNNSSETAAVTGKDSLAAKVKRGEYLAHHVALCMDCHSKRDLTKFSHPVIPGTEGIGASFPFGKELGLPGEVWAPNITPGRLKDWSDDEILRAMSEGINKAGDTLFPIMPYHNYSRVAKSDLEDIIAYIRTLPSSDSTVPPKKLFAPSMAVFGPHPPVDWSKNSKPDTADKIAYGQYLVTLASCGDCHTPRTAEGMPDFNKAFSGGFVVEIPQFKVGIANITPDSTTGIGTWTEENFLQKFRDNSSDAMVNRDPGRNNSIMPWSKYGKMRESDLKAIYAYLRTVPPVTNKVEKWPK